MSEIKREILQAVPVRSDLEMHFCLLTTPSAGVYFEIREWAISAEQYGRGVTIPPSAVPAVRDALPQVAELLTAVDRA